MRLPAKHTIARDNDADLTVSISDGRIFIDGTYAENITDLAPEHARRVAAALLNAADQCDQLAGVM
ncbi:hypothetical protein CRM90_09050 [Mycobacterium sp. ENV421]|uniref:hypothetical protein n=1 Tax=Mycobacterium sp. ENV421 TaxID=1213407 RepID=UPI000C99BE32|nr:hypothetical protein [Mycobacterium sp. ENV421]PND58127.1 hypothetical protein CRM90_09050 [Mycobacterium sp. ENV421]